MHQGKKLKSAYEPGEVRLGIPYGISGACALIYQVVWYHVFEEHLGASQTTFLVVLCAFIGGLGLGAISSRKFYGWLSGKIGGHGLRNYGRTELAITLSALVLTGLTQLPLAALVGHFPYRSIQAEGLTLFTPTLLYEGAKIGLALLAVGVPCFLMGLTFPYLCSLFPGDARLPSRLYRDNTLGASLAVLLTEFWGLPVIGYFGCLALAAGGTLLLGLWFMRNESLDAPEPFVALPDRSRVERGRFSIAPAIFSGFFCGGLQALAFILIKLTMGPTRGVFALLAFFSILGIWLASAFVHRVRPSRKTLLTLAWFGLAWCLAAWWIEPRFSEALVSIGAFRLTSASPYLAAFFTAAVGAGSIIFVPYMLWSTLLPDLCDRKQAAGEDISGTYGWNTLSFLAGVLVFGWALQSVHFFFAARAFAFTALLGLLLVTFSSWSRPVPPLRLGSLVAVAVFGIFFLPRGLEMRLVAGLGKGVRTVEAYRSNAQHLFWVRGGAEPASRTLMFDRHPMSGTSHGARTYMRGMAHFPLLLHKDPRSALLICFGVGETADAIRQHDSIQHLDIVDLNRDVFLLNRYFEGSNNSVLQDPRVNLFCDDGRQFLKLTGRTYDFATMEPPPPLQPGISRLYSAEYYVDLKRRLNKGALVSQWLPEYQLDRTAVSLICATFLDAFPHAFLFVGFGRELVLVGSEEPIDFGRLAPALARQSAVRSDLSRFGLDDAGRLLGTIMMTESSLKATWGNDPLIHDGLVGLDAILIGPVQQIHPKSTFVARKSELIFDRRGVVSELQRTAPREAAQVAVYFSDPASSENLRRVVPREYFSQIR